MLLGVSYRFTDLTSLFIIHNWINACGRSLKAFLLFILLLIIIPGYLPADVGDTTRVSVASSGAEANNESLNSDISEDGRFVSFESLASNLVANDNNATNDIFVHDRQTGQTQRVSVDSAGVESNGYSTFAAISDDGRYVAFDSAATNLVANDTNSTRDIFVHDRSTGETTRVSIDSAGNEGDSLSITPAISATGRYVAFTSYASNLIAGDTNGLVDIFVHDRDTGETSRVSVASNGDESNHNSTIPAISADGQIITFASEASNLVLNDTNLTNDIFVHDRNSGQTVRVSQSSSGTQSNNYSSYPAISGDGRYVAFQSHASNLVTGDTNGTTDIYVHDRNTHETTRVSVDSSGVPAMFLSFYPDISNSGRYVAFSSIDPNLAAGDFNSAMDIFVHDRDTAQTSLVSVRSNGVPGDGSSNTPAISGDGTIVAFESEATLLVFNDNNALTDIFVNEYTGTAPPPTESDLRISLTDSSDPVDAGGNLSLTATITNVGPADATNVISTIILDSNLTFVRVVTGNCSELSGTVNCTLGDVASGFSSQVSLLVTAPYTAGMLTSTADVSADQVDPLTANNSTSETTSVILRDIDITDSTMPTDDLTILFGTHRVGETTDEIITIHNNSLSIPVTITVITHSLSAPFMVLDPNGCDGAPLAAGDSCVLTVEYSPTVAGDSSDTLILGIGADSVDISVRGTAVENAADLAISKSADKLTVNPGVIGEDLVTFTLTVTNHGPDAANVIVTDLLPAGMQIPTGTTAVASLGSYDETTGVWSVGTMDATQPPQTETLEIPVQVVGSDTCITNTATVAMAPGETSADTNSSNNIDSVTIGTSGGCADLSITGEILVDFTTSSAGYDCLIVEVEVRVRNLGPHTATGVLIQQNAIDYNNNQFNCETGGINDAIVEQTVDLGTLASGASATATVFTHNEMQFEANHQTYRITLDYSATSDGSDPDITNNTYQDSVNITHVEQRNTHESCLIDVATRGSRVSHGLNTLRQFRDQVLNRFMAGRGVIKMYYNLSPPIASIIADSEILKSATRTLLRPIIWWAEITLDSPVLGLLLLVLVTLAPVAIVLAIRRYRLIRRCLYLVNFQRKQMT